MSVSRFLIVSFVMAGLVGPVVVWTYNWLVPDVGLQAPLFGVIAGAAVSTSGWLLVLLGMRGSPQRGIQAFGVASVLKLMGTGAVALFAKLGPWGSMPDVLIPYIAVFCLCGGMQLVLTVRPLRAVSKS